MSENDRGALPGRSALASTSVPAHLTRGAIGFGLLGAAVALTASHGPAALLLAPPGLIALRGCPTCWIAGLVQTISAGRLRRTCTENDCALAPAPPRRTGGTAGRRDGGSHERDANGRRTAWENKKRRGPGPLEEPAPARLAALQLGWQGLTPRWPRSLRLGSASGFKVARSSGDCNPVARKIPHLPKKAPP